MLVTKLQRLLVTAICASAAMISAATYAQPQNVGSSDLYAFLARGTASGILRGADVKKYPQIAAIVGIKSDTEAVAPHEFEQRFDAYVASTASAFMGLDSNGDGKLSAMEVAQKVPKLLVYFPYLDRNGDGAITLDEILSSRIVFNRKTGDHNKSSLTTVRNGIEGYQRSFDRQLSVEDADRNIESHVTAYDAFVTTETARLKAFFEKDHQKSDPVVVEPVVITGSSGNGSSSGFYPSYGMWVTNLEALTADDLLDGVGLTPGQACRAAMVGLAALGCAAISVACTGATVVTFGGFAVPCSAAIPVVCATTAAMAQLNIDRTCPAN